MEVLTPELAVTLAVIQILWELPWKGVSTWRAAQLSHKWWFIFLLVTNTFGILPIIYLRFVAKKYQVEVKDESSDTK